MCTTEQTFAWVGAIIINIAFISLIAWGESTIWWVGFLIATVYTAILFGLARAVDKRSGWDSNNVESQSPPQPPGGAEDEARHSSDESIEHNETDVVIAVPAAAASSFSVDPASCQSPDRRNIQTMPGSITSNERRMPVLANLLYGLFTLALGVTGYFLPMNFFPCYGGGGGTGDNPSNGYWYTDISSLPSDVQSWATSSTQQPSLPSATFTYFKDEKYNYSTLLFQGSDKSSSNYHQILWSTTDCAEPMNFSEILNPSQFISTSAGWGCFAGFNKTIYESSESDWHLKSSLVGCSNGQVLRTTKDSQFSFQGPYDFFVDNNYTLWFKDYPLWFDPSSGTLIYSLKNVDDTMEVTLHSSYMPGEHTPPAVGPYDAQPYDATTNYNDCWMKQSILALYISALPIAVTSILLWLKRTAPSMAVTTYVGLTAAATFIYLAITQTAFGMDDFWSWWLSISGGLYVIILSDLSHCQRNIARGPLIWGINFGALAFFIGMIFLTSIFDRDLNWRWIVFDLFVIIPLGIIGLAYKQVFLLVLCAIAWLMTTVKIAFALAPPTSAAFVPIFFVVLAISGLLIAGSGWWLNKNQGQLHSVLGHHMKQISLTRRVFPVRELEVEVAEGEHDGGDNMPDVTDSGGENNSGSLSSV